MIILPAIDVIGGQPVRLYQGDYGKKEVVGTSIRDVAASFEEAGASYLHIVDLDGAKTGRPVNREEIFRAARSVSMPAELGGGIRTMDDIDQCLSSGIDRVILGTSAVKDEQLLIEAVRRYGERIAVGIDCLNGYVKIDGWLEGSSLYYTDFAKHMEEIGVRTVIVTDISRDGTLTGPAFDMLETLRKSTGLQIIASGGIHHIDDIRRLRSMDLYGAIIGKALYAGRIDLKEALKVAV
ncbi:MAG: 1-(5-phosphoribosyl)-5-[Solobacterium sp.]|jgi:phosphoribosylformimino-5-aminoimidazole carboxamide ribotide isomerase|nr:1-(5-phosphoribosyl)-5-[(5-phosphoribosylamino)methylideneamino]imidazole-4-carboxamide isomerase [Solobacterium sp.]